jgi:hypothetical protein
VHRPRRVGTVRVNVAGFGYKASSFVTGFDKCHVHVMQLIFRKCGRQSAELFVVGCQKSLRQAVKWKSEEQPSIQIKPVRTFFELN